MLNKTVTCYAYTFAPIRNSGYGKGKRGQIDRQEIWKNNRVKRVDQKMYGEGEKALPTTRKFSAGAYL